MPHLTCHNFLIDSRPHTSLACHNHSFSLAPGSSTYISQVPTVCLLYLLRRCYHSIYYVDSTATSTYNLQSYDPTILRPYGPMALWPYGPYYGPTEPNSTRCLLLPMGFPMEPYGQVFFSFLLRQSLTPSTIAVYI